MYRNCTNFYTNNKSNTPTFLHLQGKELRKNTPTFLPLQGGGLRRGSFDGGVLILFTP